jgi:hypothetical protein
LERFKLSPKESWAKGRNGIFHPDEVAVATAHDGNIVLEVWSRRTEGEPPIIVNFSKEDAQAIARMLQLVTQS